MLGGAADGLGTNSLDRLEEGSRIERFADEVVHLSGQAAFAVGRGAVRGQARRSAYAIRCPARAGGSPAVMDAVHARHLNVHQHQIDVSVGKRGERGRPALGGGDDVAPGLKQPDRHLLVHGVVLYEQDRRGRALRSADCSAGGGQSLRFRRAAPELGGEGEPAALSRGTLDREAPVHEPHELGGDGQAEPGSAVPASREVVGLGERLEDHVLLVGGDADARIGDRELDLDKIVCHLAKRDAHVNASVLGELDGVAAEIDEDLLEAGRVADEAIRDVRRDHRRQLQPLPLGLARERRHGSWRARRGAQTPCVPERACPPRSSKSRARR